MTTACYFDPYCIAHYPGPGHSERPARLCEIVNTLSKKSAFKKLQWPAVSPAKLEDIQLVHTKRYIDFVFSSVPKSGYQKIEVNEVVSEHDDGEVTTLCPQSGNAALYAVGAVTAAVDDVMKGKVTNAFCAVRPPGHHAFPDKSMGFCIFNNVAVGARYAQKHYGIKRVAIVDFDLHHGNGTQAVFEKDPSVFFCSIHQLPLWPETGYEQETGIGNIFNVVTKPNLPRAAWLKRWRQTVLPRLRQEDFDFLFISAGFDTHKNDQKGCQLLETQDYFELTADLLSIARDKCANRVVTVLEGGYNARASAASAAAAVKALMRVKK